MAIRVNTNEAAVTAKLARAAELWREGKRPPANESGQKTPTTTVSPIRTSKEAAGNKT